MITGLYAGILGLLYFMISLEVIRARRKNRISLGYGNDQEISAIVSAHANFAAYVPLFLILLFFTESSHIVPILVLHALAVVFTVGRVLHFVAFKGAVMDFKSRVYGMHMTLWPLILLSVTCIALFFVEQLYLPAS